MSKHDRPSFNYANFDPSLTSIPDVETSRDCAAGLAAWGGWVVKILPIENGEIYLEIHQGAIAKVDIRWTVRFDVLSHKGYDKDNCVRKIDEIDTFFDAGGDYVCAQHMSECVFRVLAPVLRLSDQQFGHISLNVKNGELFEVLAARATRRDKEKWLARLAQALYTPDHLDQGL